MNKVNQSFQCEFSDKFINWKSFAFRDLGSVFEPAESVDDRLVESGPTMSIAWFPCPATRSVHTAFRSPGWHHRSKTGRQLNCCCENDCIIQKVSHWPPPWKSIVSQLIIAYFFQDQLSIYTLYTDYSILQVWQIFLAMIFLFTTFCLQLQSLGLPYHIFAGLLHCSRLHNCLLLFCTALSRWLLVVWLPHQNSVYLEVRGNIRLRCGPEVEKCFQLIREKVRHSDAS